MTIERRIEVLIELGKRLLEEDDYYMAVAKRTEYENPWFTEQNIKQSTRTIAKQYLAEQHLRKWIDHYKLIDSPISKKLGLVLAGNIPLQGFHDVLCVFVMGHRAKIKLSDQDKYLLPYVFKVIKEIDEALPGYDPPTSSSNYFELVDKLSDFDAVIATGSNNSIRYFKSYFGKYPHIIRKNKNAVGVLDGSETEEDLKALSEDVFQYFGLGSRSVAKLYVPEGYDFQQLLEVFHQHNRLVLNSKYKNNFDYNFALLIMNNVPHLSNGAIILKEDESFHSRIATLHYEFYKDKAILVNTLLENSASIQCVVSGIDLMHLSRRMEPGSEGREAGREPSVISLGKAQLPGLMDYPDETDTMDFLLTL